ncbi:MAG: hypothetical protein LQ345_007482 [Seirophora villosa]|nr:MAG: hypothetical protein LQ345_007482 [Seirophora villosa]
MRFHTLLSFTIPFFFWTLASAASWGFDDATVVVHGKKAGVGGGAKEKIVENKALPEPVVLGAADTLKLLLTATEGKKARRPHQAFLLLREPKSDLDTSFPLSVRESGKGKLELVFWSTGQESHKDLPTQFLTEQRTLSASLIIASFGSSTPYRSPAFDLKVELDPSAPPPSVEKPLRYGKLPEIHHTFKADPKSPPKIITVVFTAAVLATLVSLFFGWLSLGANLNHTSKAFGSSPLSHGAFFCSILAMEGIFFMYYTSWNLFQTLPAAAIVGLVAFLSGSRALREVQDRRLAGLR